MKIHIILKQCEKPEPKSSFSTSIWMNSVYFNIFIVLVTTFEAGKEALMFKSCRLWGP